MLQVAWSRHSNPFGRADGIVSESVMSSNRFAPSADRDSKDVGRRSHVLLSNLAGCSVQPLALELDNPLSMHLDLGGCAFRMVVHPWCVGWLLTRRRQCCLKTQYRPWSTWGLPIQGHLPFLGWDFKEQSVGSLLCWDIGIRFWESKGRLHSSAKTSKWVGFHQTPWRILHESGLQLGSSVSHVQTFQQNRYWHNTRRPACL